MEKGQLVKDIVERKPVGGVFVLTEPRLSQGRNGQPYWSLHLRDVSGSIDGKIWFPLSNRIREIPDGALAKVSGHGSLYRDQVQVVIEDMQLLGQEEIASLNMAAFTKTSDRSVRTMYAELLTKCRQEFKHPPWAKLVFSVLQDEKIKQAFCTMPAAKTVHHAHAGGLLEHTLSVFELCQLIANKYEKLDRQTLLAGALFHDLGKIRELSGSFATDYTDEGRLLGHIFLGIELLLPFLEESGLETHLAGHLRHLILSHHGELEFGAARLPQTMEAFALHYADNLDAKMTQCATALENAEPSQWSGWQSTLNRNLFLARKTPSINDPEEQQPNDHNAVEQSCNTAQATKNLPDSTSINWHLDNDIIPFPEDEDIPPEEEDNFWDEKIFTPMQAKQTQQPEKDEKKDNRAKGQERQCSLLMKG